MFTKRRMLLRRALDAFRQCGVDQVVTLGDTCDVMFRESRAAEVVGLMRDAGATGVWGNHDYSLCREISEPCRQRYSPDVLDFMAGMQGHLAIGDCLFSHVEPWLDPHDPMQLWYYEGLPDTAKNCSERSTRSRSDSCSSAIFTAGWR